MISNAPAPTRGTGLPPVKAKGVLPERATDGSAPEPPPLDPLPPELEPDPPAAAAAAAFAAAACVAVVVVVVAPACAAVFTTPQVGVVWPACTSAGVRSPQEYPACSAAVGATAPGTLALTWSTPYCSNESPSEA